MPEINLVLNQPAWPDLADRDVIHYQDPIGMSALPGGMASGATSVAFRLNLPDGRVVLAETSLSVLLASLRGIAARFQPDLLEMPEPTAEILVSAILVALGPRREVTITTASGQGPDGLTHHVAALLDASTPGEIEPLITVEADDYVDALQGVWNRLLAELDRHKAEGHERTH